MILGAITPATEILEELHDRSLGCFALTNWPHDSFTRLRARFSFLACFEGIVVSGVEGIAKPDPAIFRLLLERHQLEAASTLFVDDTPINVEAARAIGMRAHRFTTGAALAGDSRHSAYHFVADLRIPVVSDERNRGRTGNRACRSRNRDRPSVPAGSQRPSGAMHVRHLPDICPICLVTCAVICGSTH